MARTHPAVLTSVAAAALVGGVAAAAALADHPRDEDGFQTYVTGRSSDFAHVVGEVDPRLADHAWAAEHPEKLLAEGDRACEWLADEPNAPDSGTDDRYGTDALITRYLQSANMGDRIEHTDLGQRSVVGGAWNYLCLDTREDKTTRFLDED